MYSPETYHINNTHSVFVTLEGTTLRIQRPRKNVPRRAMFNVPVPSSGGAQFVHQRIYDMRKVAVSLLPAGLVVKRLWSKKYPICLTVKSDRVGGPWPPLPLPPSPLSNVRVFSPLFRPNDQPALRTTGPAVGVNSPLPSPPYCRVWPRLLTSAALANANTTRPPSQPTRSPPVGSCVSPPPV